MRRTPSGKAELVLIDHGERSMFSVILTHKRD